MKLTTTATKLITRTHIAFYRKTGGKLGGRYHGSPVVLLTTTGRRSGQRRTMPAEVADPAERARLWPPLVARYPAYDDYQAKTERQIPVVVLTPH